MHLLIITVYANAVDGMTEEWGISSQAARVGQMIFLVAYAFGESDLLYFHIALTNNLRL